MEKDLSDLIDINEHTKLEPNILNDFLKQAHPKIKLGRFEIDSLTVTGTDLVREITLQYSVYKKGKFQGKYSCIGTMIYWKDQQQILDVFNPREIKD